MKVFLFLALMTFNLAAEQKQAKPPIIDRSEITIGTQKYTGVKLVLVKANEVAIRHDSGVSRVHPSTLDPDLAKELGYDEASAKALEMANMEAAKRAALSKKLVTGAFSARIKVLSITENGLIGTAYLEDDKGKMLGRDDIFIETPTRDKGYLTDKAYEFGVRRMGSYTYTTVLGAEKTVAHYKDLLVIWEEWQSEKP